MSKRSFFSCTLAICFLALFSACEEEDTNLGIGLQDPSTIYNGTVDTAYGSAYMVLDDSLLTSGLTSAIIGSGYESDIATTVASLYTNISTPNGASLTFDAQYVIDSVVLSLAISGIYVAPADSAGSQDLHFVVTQLAHRLSKDSAYYSGSSVALGSTVFYDDVVTVDRGDTMVVNLKLSADFASIIANSSYPSADAFEEAVRGIQIRLAPSSSARNYVTINLAASATRLTAYYTGTGGDTPVSRTYDFAIGTNVTHFSRFEKNFTGACTTFNTNKVDSINAAAMYLSPMGGTNIRFNVGQFVRQFHQNHPTAIIHYAELVLPVGTGAPVDRPDALAAVKIYGNGVVANIPDMYDPFTYAGFDGTYDAARQCYRMRITQHFQDLVRDGHDLGTLVVINGRRTSWQHTVVNGDMTANPIRIEFVYSE